MISGRLRVGRTCRIGPAEPEKCERSFASSGAEMWLSFKLDASRGGQPSLDPDVRDGIYGKGDGLRKSSWGYRPERLVHFVERDVDGPFGAQAALRRTVT